MSWACGGLGGGGGGEGDLNGDSPSEPKLRVSGMEGTILVGRECSHAVGSLMNPLFSHVDCTSLGLGREGGLLPLATICPPWRLGASPESRYSLT